MNKLTDIEKATLQQQMPAGYMVCFQQDCPLHDSCMRFVAGQNLPDDRQMGNAVFPAARQGDQCRYYHKYRVFNGAAGFNTLFNNVLARHSVQLRQAIKDHLGGNGTYYLYHNGKKWLTPEQQDWILSLFRRYGYTEDLSFDQYQQMFDFD